MRRSTKLGTARSGFTLVELLVAIAVLGILLSAIVTLTSSFLGFSRQVSAINERLADLTDAMGYVGLNARASMRVYGEPGATRLVSFGGPPFTCAIDDPDEPCIAFVVPEVNRATGLITGFDFVAYSVRPLSAWAANPGVPPGWNGTDTQVLLEYRRQLCTGCTNPPEAPATVDATRVSLVIADLFLEFDAGGAIAPFAVTTDSSRVTLQLRTRGSGLNDGIRVPNDGPLTQFIVRRP